MFKRIVAIGVVSLAVIGMAVPAANATGSTTVAFLCYSQDQVDPGVWPLVNPTPGHHHSAAQLMALGYWSPYAETSVPTGTRIANGYYLMCNLPATLSPVVGKIITQKGIERPTDAWNTTHPGYYPAAA